MGSGSWVTLSLFYCFIISYQWFFLFIDSAKYCLPVGVTCVLGRQKKNKSLFFYICDCTVAYFYTSTFKDLTPAQRLQVAEEKIWIQTFNLGFLKPWRWGGREVFIWTFPLSRSQDEQPHSAALRGDGALPHPSAGEPRWGVISSAPIAFCGHGSETWVRHPILWVTSWQDGRFSTTGGAFIPHPADLPTRFTGLQQMSAAGLGFQNAQRQTRQKQPPSLNK